MVRVPGCGPGGRGFESHYSPHFPKVMGCSQAVKATDFDSVTRRSKSCHPSQFDPLAQSVEHLTFNQGVRSSNLRWVTIWLTFQGPCGRGGMADAPDLGSGADRRKSSSLFVRIHPSPSAVVAQLVERHLAKVEVASPSLVYRSICTISSVGRAPDS